MASLKKVEAKNWGKCVCCSAQWRTCEKFLQVINDNDKPRRGERYCVHCEKYAHMNNPDIREVQPACDGESHLRSMEDYAAYSAAGATSAYWEDRDAGYAR